MTLYRFRSTFSIRLSKFGVNFYEMFAPDLMHEFELGVWKGIFHHLMRILEAKGKGTVEEFNSRSVFDLPLHALGTYVALRMRRMPTFGRDRIRRFSHNVATRKRLAARDYEAYLMVSTLFVNPSAPICTPLLLHDAAVRPPRFARPQ